MEHGPSSWLKIAGNSYQELLGTTIVAYVKILKYFVFASYYYEPVASIAAPVLMLRATCSPSNPIHILVGLARVLSKINPSTEHATYVGMALVKPFLSYGL